MSLLLRTIILLGCIIIGAVSAFANNGKIQGKVKEENGKALADVSVKAVRAVTRSLDSQESNNTYATKTNDKGEFILDNLAAGIYTITFEITGFRTFVTRRFEIAAGETFKVPKPIEMTRERAPYGLIRGAVLDNSGYSVVNASVVIERTDSKGFKKIEKNSIEGGQFAFRVPAEKGVYRITASADGFITATKEVTIDGDEIRQIVVQLEKKN